MNEPVRDLIFVCSAEEDKSWVEELSKFLKPGLRNKPWQVWDESKIDIGDDKEEARAAALARARVAVLIMTQELLSSDPITDHQIPRLIDAAEKEGLLILTVPVGATDYETTWPEIGRYQPTFRGEVLAKLPRARRDQAWVEVARAILAAAERGPRAVPASGGGIRSGSAAKGGAAGNFGSTGSSAAKPAKLTEPPAGLRELLVRLVGDPSVIRMIVGDARLPGLNINIYSGIETIWHEVLTTAVHNEQLGQLLEVMTRRFPGNSELQTFAGMV